MPTLSDTEFILQKLRAAANRISGQTRVGMAQADVAQLSRELRERLQPQAPTVLLPDLGVGSGPEGSNGNLLADMRNELAGITERTGISFGGGSSAPSGDADLDRANERLRRAITEAKLAGVGPEAERLAQQHEKPGFLNKALGWLDAASAFVQGMIKGAPGAKSYDLIADAKQGIANAGKALRGEQYERVFDTDNVLGQLTQDILFDPLTYLTFGLSGAGKEAGENAVKILRRVADEGPEVLRAIARGEDGAATAGRLATAAADKAVEAGRVGAREADDLKNLARLSREAAEEALSDTARKSFLDDALQYEASAAEKLAAVTGDTTRATGNKLKRSLARRLAQQDDDVMKVISALGDADPADLHKMADALEDAMEISRRRGPLKAAFRNIANESDLGKAVIKSLPVKASPGTKLVVPFTGKGVKVTKGTVVSGRVSEALDAVGVFKRTDQALDYWNTLRKGIGKGLSGKAFGQVRDVMRRMSVSENRLRLRGEQAAHNFIRGMKKAGLTGAAGIHVFEEVGGRPLEEAGDAVADLVGRLVSAGVDPAVARKAGEGFRYIRYELLEKSAAAGSPIEEMLGYFPHVGTKQAKEAIAEYKTAISTTPGNVPLGGGASTYRTGHAAERGLKGTITELNNWFEAKHGVKLFEDDLGKALYPYVRGMSRHVARNEAISELVSKGIAKEVAHDAGRIIDEATDSAENIATVASRAPEGTAEAVTQVLHNVPKWETEFRRAGKTVKMPRAVDEMFRNVVDHFHNPGKLEKLLDGFNSFWRAAAITTPGFVLRNAYGIVWQNFVLAGVKPSSAIKALRMLAGDFGTTARATGEAAGPLSRMARGALKKLGDADLKLLEQAAKHGVIDKNFYESMRGLAEVPPDDFRALFKMRANPLSGDNFLTHTIMRGQSAVENWGRLSVFIDAVEKRGLSFAEAADRSHFFHFAYDELTPFEKRWGRKLVGFYTWTKNNIPLQMQAFAHRPAKLLTAQRLADAALRASGTDDDAGFLPDYARRLMPLPLFEGFFLAEQLPPFDLNDLPGSLDELAEFKLLLEYGSPALKTLVTLMTRGAAGLTEARPYEIVPAPSWTKIPVMNQFLKAFGWLNEKDGTTYANEKVVEAIGEAFPYLARWDDLFPNEKHKKQKVIQRVFSYFLGLGVAKPDSRDRANETNRQAGEVEDLTEQTTGERFKRAVENYLR